MQLREQNIRINESKIGDLKEQVYNFNIVDELFVIPDDDKYILYAPLSMSIMIVNGAVIQFLKDFKHCSINNLDFNAPFIRQLIDGGILITNNTHIYSFDQLKEDDQFDPQGITLFLTTTCSMKCIYCYAEGGQKAKRMPWETAQTVINWIIDHTIAKGKNKFYVMFHGGGEVTTAEKLLRKCVKLINQESSSRGINSSIHAGLNGVMRDSTLDWIISNFNDATISLDGLPEIQNFQRPLSNRGDSFQRVSHTLQYMDQHNFSLGSPLNRSASTDGSRKDDRDSVGARLPSVVWAALHAVAGRRRDLCSAPVRE